MGTGAGSQACALREGQALWTEAWVWGDERELSPSPRPTENLPGLGVRVRLYLKVSRPLWAPGSHWSDDHWLWGWWWPA